MLNGKPFRYISGTMHYFRVPRAYWEDRMMKMKAAGLNTLQTYIAWNMHEPFKGQYNFDGQMDLFAYLETAKKVGLYVVLRPGPFIDAEWDMGGLPFWLLHEKPWPLLRTNDPRYMRHVEDWYAYVLPKLKQHLFIYGGSVLTVQIENEYGSYWACDHEYVDHLRVLTQKYLGEEVTLFTTDGCDLRAVKCGINKYAQATIDFGATNTTSALFDKQLRPLEPTGPAINSEFYPGWLNWWGNDFQARTTAPIVSTLQDILDYSEHSCVNIYVFHGGTNLGFRVGANFFSRFWAGTTSYDYDAPLNEAGDTTDKYLAIRETLQKYHNSQLPPYPANSTKVAIPTVRMNRIADLFQDLSLFATNAFTRQDPPTFEEVLQDYGYALYRHELVESISNVTVIAKGIHDRAIVYVDTIKKGILDRGESNFTLQIGDIKSGQILHVLLENQGRNCYGAGINDTKGINIESPFLLNTYQPTNWTMYTIPLNQTNFNTSNSPRACFAAPQKAYKGPDDPKTCLETPALYEGFFYNTERSANGIPADTFLRLDANGWSKGVAFVNGHNLGRYWPVKGPQVTLFVPGAFLNVNNAKNHLVLFETDASPCASESSCEAAFSSEPYLNKPTGTNYQIPPLFPPVIPF